MEILQAIFLGIIEGLTEFLPISSTGHLLLAQDIIGYKDTAEIFAVVVQMGALGAVLWHYKKDLFSKAKGLFDGKKSSVEFWRYWVIATIPAVVVGFVMVKYMDIQTSSSIIIALTLIVGGVAIWLIEDRYYVKPSKPEPQFNSLTTLKAFSIGLYQVLALVPGISRSGATIMGGILNGLDRVTATAFSFYLSIPILLIAGIYKLTVGFDVSTVSGGGQALVLGTLASFITSFIAIAWLLKYITRHNFKLFAYYRIVLGVAVLARLVV